MFKLISKLKLKIVRRKRKRAKILFNVFSTKNRKRALVSYVKDVFENDYAVIDQSHTNKLKTFCIAKILCDLGYNVDVIDWRSKFDGNLSSYDVVIGLGQPLEDVLVKRPIYNKPSVVCFGTGCSSTFMNKVTLERVADFHRTKKKNLFASSRFDGGFLLQQTVADWIIVHGDDFAKSTYRNFNIDSVLAPVFIHHSISRSDSDWLISKSNYLWFGSSGALHKGLDLLIDAFKKLPQYSLHICGNLEIETEFYDYYKDDFKRYPNIFYHGFVKVTSVQYAELLRNCAFSIFPSASEGNCPSVLTCMANGGLIPVVTKNADINIENYGVEIFGFQETDILDAIERSQQLSLEELKSQSSTIVAKVTEYHSFDGFQKDFKQKLIKIFNSDLVTALE